MSASLSHLLSVIRGRGVAAPPPPNTVCGTFREGSLKNSQEVRKVMFSQKKDVVEYVPVTHQHSGTYGAAYIADTSDDLTFAAGLLRLLAGVTMLAWAALYYMMPLAQWLLALQLPATASLEVLMPLAINALLKLAGATVLVWPGMYLLRG